ncbi:hypothetical protein [Vibrio sp. OPT18]|uniref:hypothetical protein n=1 Tax=Vibrio sp. OPT18 TaxID=2778641 RepID=UPI00187EF589|nr:hypothetical protein [Vibrio sp. OPT18]MBE8578651.1 hypothetical protein [Vibrio sp. OPT18]
MIINYESAVNAIKEDIAECTSSPSYEGYEPLRNVVNGMCRALSILENLEIKSSYSKALAGLDKNDLQNIKSCVEVKIREIEKEDEVTLYCLSIDGLALYYSRSSAARKGCLRLLDELVDDYQELRLVIKPKTIPLSELSSYDVVE